MYSIRLLAAVYDERKVLPGNVRQRMKNLIESLAQAPRPHNSIELNLEGVDIDWEIRRIRLGGWRVIYAIDEEFQQVAVLGIRKRPPYDYEDISDLLANLE
ncbi:plasmid stabilization system [Scytonema sp. UIC 10036]|uniref:type II toxin-antitoxin system RelE family toxin n=1 Tax=Scytonema sp. UIC 10036 TaxID=2304196 RepID=UPI0012DA27AC|nr:type II toxin-antitoxin system RelE/ParE family toxin [Scytonema sp. UIC 10036]MUG93921.1 plasmid stabilization system [Scytonema sp. UIC 10036]